MRVLVTGTAGFIGAETALQLLQRGDEVIGIDNVNDYYSVELKRDRLARLTQHRHYDHNEFDLADAAAVAEVFKAARIDRVVHLAAQAGVRYSLENPFAYTSSNVDGFMSVLEACRHHEVEHLVFASSSSVYGSNTRMPFSVHDNVDHPVSLYAATKKANEVMAHTYSHLYGLPTTGLRFFTVYGPWGRPDMSPFLFADRIFRGEPIDVFNHGRHQRDFTFVADIVEGILRTLDHAAQPNPDWDSDAPDPASSRAPYRLYNIGNGRPVELLSYIRLIEKAAGRTAKLNMLPLQPGDVIATWADVSDLEHAVGYRPRVQIEEGVERFVKWYRDYYAV
jgi:UDP-glucuronate 4-epimerase